MKIKNGIFLALILAIVLPYTAILVSTSTPHTDREEDTQGCHFVHFASSGVEVAIPFVVDVAVDSVVISRVDTLCSTEVYQLVTFGQRFNIHEIRVKPVGGGGILQSLYQSLRDVIYITYPMIGDTGNHYMIDRDQIMSIFINPAQEVVIAICVEKDKYLWSKQLSLSGSYSGATTWRSQ